MESNRSTVAQKKKRGSKNGNHGGRTPVRGQKKRLLRKNPEEKKKSRGKRGIAEGTKLKQGKEKNTEEMTLNEKRRELRFEFS